MTSLDELVFNYKLFLDRTTVLFGESGTGKSFVIVDILKHLQPYAEQILVISPTDMQNNTYSGIVPKPCIHYTLTAQLLEDMWERQDTFAGVSKKADNPDVIRSLFSKIPSKNNSMIVIDSVYKKLSDYKAELKNEYHDDAVIEAKFKDMDKKCKELIQMIYKKAINDNTNTLSKMNLTIDEQFTLKYINFNPRLVLIFDDCTDLLKKFKTHPVMQKLFYQGRHAKITALIACHTDKALDPELKKNAFVSIFTEETCAHAYFERKSNDLDRDAKDRAKAACKIAFTPLAKFQKLAWVREEKKFYRFTAASHPPFKFGNEYIWEYCKQIQTEAGMLNSNSKFIHNFL